MSNNCTEVKKASIKDVRIFSLIWSFIFLIIAVWPLSSGEGARGWAITIAGLFLIVALMRPMMLSGFYSIWTRFGELMGGVISKVTLVILFYSLITPFGLVFRILKKDPLNKKLKPDAVSYWVVREIQPGSLKNQF